MRISRILAILLCGWILASCSREPGERVEQSSDPVVANVGSEVITLSQLQAELARRSPGFAAVPGSRDQVQAVLEEMIRRKAAFLKAREQKLDRDPATAALIEQLIASRYVESQLTNAGPETAAVSEAEIEQFYQSRTEAYQLPAKVRCGVLCLRLPSKAEPAKRVELQNLAQKLRQEAATASDAQFAQLVQQHSDDQSTRYIGGDTGWLAEGASSPHWPRQVLTAAFALGHAGEVAPLVESPDAFYIIRLTERSEGGVRPLAEVREAIRYQLAQARQFQQQQAFFDELKRGLNIRINQDAIDTLPPPASTATASAPNLPGG